MSLPKTQHGGLNEYFSTTHWTQIVAARGGDAQGDAVLNELMTRYWKPVYAFVRRKGYENEHAKDLTQGFFFEVVLKRRLFELADPQRGRFRTFLLTALNRYLADAYRAEKAQKRWPGGGIVNLEDVDASALPEQAEEAYHYAWVTDLIDRVLASVEQECRDGDQITHWEVFRRRVLLPVIEDSKPPSLPKIASELGVEATPKELSNMLITVRRHVKAAMKRAIRPFVVDDGQIEPEVRELLKALSGR